MKASSLSEPAARTALPSRYSSAVQVHRACQGMYLTILCSCRVSPALAPPLPACPRATAAPQRAAYSRAAARCCLPSCHHALPSLTPPLACLGRTDRDWTTRWPIWHIFLGRNPNWPIKGLFQHFYFYIMCCNHKINSRVAFLL